MISEKFFEAEGFLAEQLKFLQKAVSEDETRPAMQEIYIEQSDKGKGQLVGVATDGRHIHIVDPLASAATEVYGMIPGYWRCIRYKDVKEAWMARLRDKDTGGLAFPNWRKVIPHGKDVKYKTTFEGFTFQRGISSNHGGLAVFLHDFPETSAYNLEYLESLGTSLEWKVEWYGPQKSLKFISGDFVSVIMPIQIE
jgi:hypothetical protein